MIIAGKFDSIDIHVKEQPLRGYFTSDSGTEYKLLTNIKRLQDMIDAREYYIEDVLFLVNVKEIEKTDWYYIIDAMVFGD